MQYNTIDKEKIIQGNKLIAEYMGYEYIGWNDPNHRCYHVKKGYWGIKGAQCHSLMIEDHMKFNPLSYHSSWNELMPVCRKIIESYFDARQDIFKALMECDIDQTFNAVVKFIEFWNDPSQPKITWTNSPKN